MDPHPLRTFFTVDAVTLARRLLGQRLVRTVNGRRLAGTIVEVEAYLGEPDKAAHTYGGRRTPRNETMWGEAGCVYVYFTYGMHHCMNIVAAGPGRPQAVLLRAIEPTEGLDLMRRHRPKARRDADLCSGPAKLCQALQVDRRHDGTDLLADKALRLERVRGRAYPDRLIAATPRIGVDYAEEWAPRPLRFHLKGNVHVSKR